ncbi:MAG: mechanosensitive ion channel, partial [Flavobacteriaceae bacterium]|nr:mechanosensitive ion channel [Flavobacteriaceae bacterium]
MNAFRNFIELLNYKLTIGNSLSFTPKSILIVILVFVSTFFFLKLFRKIIYRTLSSEAKLKFKSIFSFFNYFVYTIVILLSFQNVGVDLTAVFAASAALLVGVGLALQTFIQDIISGVFIIVDQSV